jgi:hypothetical protein
MALVEKIAPFTQEIVLHGTSWQSYVSNLVSGASGRQQIMVLARFGSLKNLVCLPRRQTEIANQNAYSISSRANPNFSEANWLIGSLQVPQRPYVLKNSNYVGGYGAMHAAVLKSFHALGNFDITGSIPADYFNVADASDGTAKIAAINSGSNSYKNAFAIAQDLEAFVNRTDVILTGVNTLSASPFFVANIETATTAAYTLNFYACFDHLLKLGPEGLYSVSF